MSNMRHSLRIMRGLGLAGAALQSSTSPLMQTAGSSLSPNSKVMPSVSSLSSYSRVHNPGLFSIGALQLFNRSISGTTFALAPAAVESDAEPLLQEINRIVTSETVTAKEVSDSAVALAYMRAKDSRRLWGKIFEKADALKATFDPSSLSNFLWATTTCGVDHFKTLFELSGPASALLKNLSPAQLSLVVEGLGRVGACDSEFMSKVADQVSSNVGSYKPAELARILWGYAAAGEHQLGFIRLIAKTLGDRASELAGREATQAIWALARLRLSERQPLEALASVAKSKIDSGVDAAALAWSLGSLNYKPDAGTSKAIASALQSAAPSLAAGHAIDAAWGLGVIGAGTKESVGALFANVGTAVKEAPDSLDPHQVAALYEAAAMTPEAKLPEQVSNFASKMYTLVGEGKKSKLPASMLAFKDELAEAVAYAMGARYRPEIADARKSLAAVTSGGVAIDIAVNEGNTKIAFEAVDDLQIGSTGTILGAAAARAKLLDVQGFKPVLVSMSEFMQREDTKAKAKHVLELAKAAVPSTSSKIEGLKRKVAEPFNPYQ